MSLVAAVAVSISVDRRRLSWDGLDGLDSRRDSSLWVLSVGAALSFVVMAGAQIAIPLRPVHHRAGLTSVVVVSFACATALLVCSAWGARRGVLAIGTIVAASLVIERLGSSTGWPFGVYHYTGELRPSVYGVPLIVPLAWMAMSVPAWELSGNIPSRRRTRLVWGALALVAWDFFLDPQMVKEGYWRWRAAGFYRHIPLSNFAGWLVVALGVMAVLARIDPAGEASAAGPSGVARARLSGLYGWMAIMETVGFVVFFGDPLVGLVGGAFMLTPVVLALKGSGAGLFVTRLGLRRG